MKKDFGEICNDCFKEDGFSWNENYRELWRTLENKKGEKDHKLIMSGFPEVLEFYILDDGEGKIKLTNGELIVEVSLNKLKEAKGWNGLFLRGETTIVNLNKDKVPLLLSALLNFYKEKRLDVLEYVGIHGNEVVMSGITIDKNGVSKENNCKTLGNISDVMSIKTEKLNEKERIFLKENIHKFRGVNAVSWASATWLNIEKIKFPILGDFRITSKGKTYGMEVLLMLTGCSDVKNCIKACNSLTNAQLKRFFTMSNVVPIVIDDYKSNEKKNYKIDIETILRTIFEGGKMVQATVSKEMIEFDVIRPVAITGENSLVNGSSNNRMILVEDVNCPSNIREKISENDFLIFKKLAYELMLKRLNRSEEDIYKDYSIIRKELILKNKEINERIVENYAILKMGAKSLDEVLGTNFYEQISIKDCEKTKYNIYDTLSEILKICFEEARFEFNRETTEYKNGVLLIHSLELFETYRRFIKDEIIEAETITSVKEFKEKIISENVILHKQKRVHGYKKNQILEIKIDLNLNKFDD